MTTHELVASRPERVNSVLNAVGAPTQATTNGGPASKWDNRQTWDNWHNR